MNVLNLRNSYIYISQILRNTPLKRISWISRIHNWMFEKLGQTNKIQLSDFTLNIDSRDRIIAKKLALYGEYESYMREVLLSFAKSGSIVVDIGANIGLHTIPLSNKIGNNGKVIAFEPDPENFILLESSQ